MRVVATVYNAGFHCLYCTKIALGDAAYEQVITGEGWGTDNYPVDGEGNPIGVVFSTDEMQGDEYCDTCLAKIGG